MGHVLRLTYEQSLLTFWGKLMGKSRLTDRCVGNRVLFKRILIKHGMRAQTGVVWL